MLCSGSEAIFTAIQDEYVKLYMPALPAVGDDAVMRGDFASQAIETACSAGFANFCIGKGEVHHPEGCDIEKLPATPDMALKLRALCKKVVAVYKRDVVIGYADAVAPFSWDIHSLTNGCTDPHTYFTRSSHEM